MCYLFTILCVYFRATNAENKEMNDVRNQVTGQFGDVPGTARYYKVYNQLCCGLIYDLLF